MRFGKRNAHTWMRFVFVWCSRTRGRLDLTDTGRDSDVEKAGFCDGHLSCGERVRVAVAVGKTAENFGVCGSFGDFFFFPPL